MNDGKIPNEGCDNERSLMRSSARPLTRRELIKKSFAFSSGLIAAEMLSKLGFAQTAFPESGMHLLAFGDFGSANDQQVEVARQMAIFAGKLPVPLTAVMGLGDNFYKDTTPTQFETGFELMYAKDTLNCPFYNLIGNHDYHDFDADTRHSWEEGQVVGPHKYEVQLEYARNNPSSRWKLPAKWYAVEWPNAENPLVKLVVLDANFRPGYLTPEEKVAQKQFLEAELARPSRAPWLWLSSHFPIFLASGGNKFQPYIEKSHRTWLLDCMKAHGVSFYWAGHKHNLQHVEIEGYNTSFVTSGAGGARLHEVKNVEQGFGSSVLGFNHIFVTPEKIDTQFIDSNGNLLHAFRRSRSGEVTILPASPGAAKT